MVKYVTTEVCDAKESALKEDVIEIKQEITQMRENHLAHMQSSLFKMEQRMNLIEWKVALISSVATLVIAYGLPLLGKVLGG